MNKKLILLLTAMFTVGSFNGANAYNVPFTKIQLKDALNFADAPLNRFDKFNPITLAASFVRGRCVGVDAQDTEDKLEQDVADLKAEMDKCQSTYDSSKTTKDENALDDAKANHQAAESALTDFKNRRKNILFGDRGFLNKNKQEYAKMVTWTARFAAAGLLAYLFVKSNRKTLSTKALNAAITPWSWSVNKVMSLASDVISIIPGGMREVVSTGLEVKTNGIKVKTDFVDGFGEIKTDLYKSTGWMIFADAATKAAYAAKKTAEAAKKTAEAVTSSKQ
jgi:hypothetical protein